MSPRLSHIARRFAPLAALWALLPALLWPAPAMAGPEELNPILKSLWPNTDFETHAVDYAEIQLGCFTGKDCIRSIDDPVFASVIAVDHLVDREPVIGFNIGEDYRAYPLRMLMRHEIVNDVVGGVPVAVTFCPLCNTAVVYDRRVEGQVLEFGVSGMLRNSDLVMYDRQTESWWQQFVGEAIVGTMTGTRLEAIPARLESFAKFRERAPLGQVLVPPSSLDPGYDSNPYVGYDSRSEPYGFFTGPYPEAVAALERLVTVGEEAWSLSLVRREKTIVAGDLVITWEPGQASALDTPVIAEGIDVGNVLVQRQTDDGLEDVVYGVDFAFAFHAFHPDAVIHTD